MKNKVLNRETVSYLVIGVLTTVVDYIVFALVNEGLKRAGVIHPDPALTATAVAWLAAVTFAFVTNKTIVFESRDWGLKNTLCEAATFFAARIISGQGRVKGESPRVCPGGPVASWGVLRRRLPTVAQGLTDFPGDVPRCPGGPAAPLCRLVTL